MQLKKEPKRGKKRGFFSRKKDEEASIDGSAVEATAEVVAGTTPDTEVSEPPTPEDVPEVDSTELVETTEPETSVDQVDHGQDGDQPWAEVTAHLPDVEEEEDEDEGDEEEDEGLADTSLFADGEEQDDPQPESAPEPEPESESESQTEDEDGDGEESGKELPTGLQMEESTPPSAENAGEHELVEVPSSGTSEGMSFNGDAALGVVPVEEVATPISEGGDTDTDTDIHDSEEGTLTPTLAPAADSFALSEPPTFTNATEDTQKGWLPDTSCCHIEESSDTISSTEGMVEPPACAEVAEPQSDVPPLDEVVVSVEGVNGEEQSTSTDDSGDIETTEIPEPQEDSGVIGAQEEGDEDDGDSLPSPLSEDKGQEESHLLIENRPSDVDPVTSLPKESWDSAVDDDLHLAVEEFGDEDPVTLYRSIARVAHALPVALRAVHEQECPICGEVHKLLELSYATHLNKGGTPVTFASVHDYCPRHEVIFTTEKRAFQNYTSMCDAYKKGEGLLTGEEISAILDRYGMTPENFDTIFDWDAGATSSFIAGDTQNLIHDGVIRKVGNEPLWFYGILLPCDKELLPEEFARIESATRTVCEGFDPDGLKELLDSREGGHSAISGNLGDIPDDTEKTAAPVVAEGEDTVESAAATLTADTDSEAPTDGDVEEGADSVEESKEGNTHAAKPKKERRPIFGFLRRKRKETEDLKDAEDPFEEGEPKESSLPEIDLGDPEAAAGALSQYDENGVIQPKEVKRARDEYHPVSHTAEEDEDNTPPSAPLDGEDMGDEDLPPDPEEEAEDGDEEETSAEGDESDEDSSKRGRFGRRREGPKKESRRERRKRERAEAALLEEEEEEEDEEDEDDEGEEDSMSSEDYEEEYEAPKDTAKDVLFFLIEIIIGAAVTALIGYQVSSVYLQNLVSTYLGG